MKYVYMMKYERQLYTFAYDRSFHEDKEFINKIFAVAGAIPAIMLFIMMSYGMIAGWGNPGQYILGEDLIKACSFMIFTIPVCFLVIQLFRAIKYYSAGRNMIFTKENLSTQVNVSSVLTTTGLLAIITLLSSIASFIVIAVVFIISSYISMFLVIFLTVIFYLTIISFIVAYYVRKKKFEGEADES